MGWRRRAARSSWSESAISPLAALILLVSLGALRYQISLPPDGPKYVAWYNDTGIEMAVVGLVIGPPDHRNTFPNLRVRVERLRLGREVIHLTPEGVQR